MSKVESLIELHNRVYGEMDALSSNIASEVRMSETCTGYEVIRTDLPNVLC